MGTDMKFRTKYLPMTLSSLTHLFTILTCRCAAGLTMQIVRFMIHHFANVSNMVNGDTEVM